MRSFADLRIRSKLIAIMVLTGAGVLLLATGATLVLNYRTARQTTESELRTLAGVVGQNSVAAMRFLDVDSAQETLAALGVKPSIVAARLYGDDGTVFSTYAQASAAIDEHLDSEEVHAAVAVARDGFTRRAVAGRRGWLTLAAPLMVDGERQGVILLVDDQSELQSLLRGYYTVTLAITLVSIVLVILLSSRLQRLFSEPVRQLIDVMRRVTADQDYAGRVPRLGRDEFGELSDVFNEMLREVQLRDEQLAEHGRQLEGQVRERTAELSHKNEQLNVAIEEAERARDAAEAASRAKSEFLATMSHEIRTPMNGVLGMADLLMDTGLDAKQAEFAGTIQRSGESLLHIINDILDFSKIESGRLELESVPFDLERLAADTVDLLGEQARAKGLELLLDVNLEERTAVVGDPNRMRQVLINLLGNAIKFTERGAVTLQVSMRPYDEHRVAASCRVVDTGVGINTSALEHIFESFRQADGSTTRRFGGTGLGLTISRQLVELMGGEMGVESEMGLGSTFWFELLMERAAEAPAAEQTPSDLSPGLRVLVADHHREDARVLTASLSEWSVAFTHVRDAESVLAELATAGPRPYHAVIFDHRLPGAEEGSFVNAVYAASGDHLPVLVRLRSGAGNTPPAGETPAELDKPIRIQELRRVLSFLETDAPKSVPSPAGRRILLAEDNPVNQEVARAMIQRAGHEVDVAADGEAAVRLFRKGRYDLVLMDCQMPGMDGFMATREIRRLEEESGARRVAVIALTANVQKGIREDCSAAGMDDYLSKPFSRSQLEDTLARWFQAQPLPTVSDAAEAPDLPVMDASVLAELDEMDRPGEPPFVAAMTESYLKALVNHVAAIEGALRARDASTLRNTAHTLKSSSGFLGLKRLQGLCLELEQAGAAGDTESAAARLEEFHREVAAGRAALDEQVALRLQT